MHRIFTSKSRECVQLTVFDLDHTLLTSNSSFRFGFYLYQQKFFSFFKLVTCLSDYVRHKWLKMPIHKLHQKTFESLFKGHALSIIQEHVDQFLTLHLQKMLYHPVIQRLKEAQMRGDYILILSSSPDFLVEAIACRLGVKEWEATRYQTNHLGYFVQIAHILEGQDKADYVHHLTAKMNLPLTSVTVYSDSYLDLPILNLAGQAIAVSPDSQLKRICQQKGWEII